MLALLKTAVFSVCVVAVAATAAQPAFLTPSEMRHEATQLGFPTEGVDFIVDPEADLNAFFVAEGVYCMLWMCEQWATTLAFTGNWSGTPYELRLAVFLHELGHYRQHLDGRAFDEWDADVYAADELCRRGLDGVYWFTRAAEFIVADRGWDAGGGVHGTWMQRVENVRANARGCQGVQS